MRKGHHHPLHRRIGIGIAANKIHGIRCVTGSDCFSAKRSRGHNNSNMLWMGARVAGGELAKKIARIWLEAPYEGGRHRRRVEQIARLEQQLDIER